MGYSDGVAELWADLGPVGGLSLATQLAVVRMPVLARGDARLEDHDGRVYVVSPWDPHGEHRHLDEPEEALGPYAATVEEVLGEVLSAGVAPTVPAREVA